MAKSNPNLTSIFTDIANSIRAKKRTSEDIYPVDFADEIATITGGGSDQPQLHAVTGLSQSVGIATWTGDSYTEAYKLYLDNSLVNTLTTPLYDLTTLTVTVGSHIFGVAATATNFIDATPSTLTFAKHSITVNIINGTYSGPSTMYNWDTVQLVVTPNEGLNVEITSVTNASYSFNSSTNILTLSNATENVVVNIECKADVAYIIGFRGMSQSDPALTRTGEAVGATWTASTLSSSENKITVSGINVDKIWGGYIGNDGEALTWDSTNNKYLYNGEEYTGNVFSKINHFFVKPFYVEVDNEQVLDGFDLCYGVATAPDATWQDWFLGKEYVGIGCYKNCSSLYTPTALVSKAGQIGRSNVKAESIVASYKYNSTSSGNLHEKWYNENAILQVLFMTIFATRQANDVFTSTGYHTYDDGFNATGYLDKFRAISNIATGYNHSSDVYGRGNIFLGIEDFLGRGVELIAGVRVLNNGTDIQCSTDYANFSYSDTYTSADINLAAITSGDEIKSLQLSSSIVGLLIPATTTSNSSLNTYFCDSISRQTKNPTYIAPWFGGAFMDGIDGGVFYCSCHYQSSTTLEKIGTARLCRTPA